MHHSRRTGRFLALTTAILFTAAPALGGEPDPSLDLLGLGAYLGAEAGGAGSDGSSLGEARGSGRVPLWRLADQLSEAAAAAAVAPPPMQQEIPPPWASGQEEPYSPPPGIYPYAQPPRTHELALGGYAADIFGTGVDLGGFDVDYDELFGSGTGGRLVWRLNLNRRRSPIRLTTWGPSLVLDTVTFQGGDTVTDAVGDTLELDDMTITRFLVGIHFRSVFSHFFMGGHFALGLTYISAVDGTFNIAPFGLVEAEFYDDTVTFGVDFEFRLGGRWDLAPPVALSVFGFLGFGYNGSPSDGDDVNSLDAGPMGVAYIGLGAAIEFGGSGEMDMYGPP